MRLRLTVLFALLALCTGWVFAVDGIAISTHRIGGSDAGPGVHPSIFGNLVRYDIRNNLVTKRQVIYEGKARGAVINQEGTKVAFIKLDGCLQVMNIDGTGLTELVNSKNHNASALDWPVGEWVYYSEQGKWPGGDWNRPAVNTPDAKTIHRVNVVSGEDEVVGMTPDSIWQLSLSANAHPGAGKFAITNYLLDFANPSEKLNVRTLACGTTVSPDGSFTTEVMENHANLRIYDWSLDTVLCTFRVNEFSPKVNDGRISLYRPRWSVNSDRWITLTQGTDFGCTQQTNMVLYNWKDKQQIQVTDNPLGGNENDEGEDFWLAGASTELGIGAAEGKTPFTVSLGEGTLQGQWTWTFGDGATAKGPVGKHTYTKPGTYIVKAQQGDRVLTREVRIAAATRPQVTLYDVLDNRHVLLRFNEPVQLKEAKITVASTGAPVAGMTLKPGTGQLLVELPADLIGKSETLLLKGIFDLAQVPNPAVDKVTITPPSWPTNRDKLAFLWENQKARNFVYNPLIKSDMEYSLFIQDGLSKYTRDGAILLDNQNKYFTASPYIKDRYPFTSATEMLKEYCKDAITVEAVITPENLTQQRQRGLVTILCVGRVWRDDNWKEGALWLGQQGNELRFLLATDGIKTNTQDPVTLCTLPDTGTHHVLVSYTPGQLTAYLDGQRVLTSDAWKGKINASAFTIWSLLFGMENYGGGATWRGALEGVGIYGRALDEKEAKANYDAYQTKLRARKVVPQIEVQAKLVAATHVNTLADIAPYDDALVVCEYEVQKVLHGTYAPKRLRVAHWGVVQKRITGVNQVQVGATMTMTLEPLADNPQLEAIFIKDTLPEDDTLDLFVEAGK